MWHFPVALKEKKSFADVNDRDAKDIKAAQFSRVLRLMDGFFVFRKRFIEYTAFITGVPETSQ